MKWFMLLILGAILTPCSLSGCAARSDFTVISGKNVNLTNIKVNKSMFKGRTSGEDCRHFVFLFPIAAGPATIDVAIDRALVIKRANLLVDAILKYNWIGIPLIYWLECWKVEGVAYDTFK